MTKKIGVLAIQGSFAEHGAMLKSMGQDYIWVKDKEALEAVTHLIIPGGESTTMRKLLETYGMWAVLWQRTDLRIFGTCAGAILLAEAMDIEIDRNAYGAQQESFAAELDLAPPLDKEEIGGRFKGVFIRAPRIDRVGEGVKVLASYDGVPVLVHESLYMAATFHPELSGDKAVYEYFLAL